MEHLTVESCLPSAAYQSFEDVPGTGRLTWKERVLAAWPWSITLRLALYSGQCLGSGACWLVDRNLTLLSVLVPRLLDLDQNRTFGSLGSPVCLLLILGVFNLHHYVSQFLTINLLVCACMSVPVYSLDGCS